MTNDINNKTTFLFDNKYDVELDLIYFKYIGYIFIFKICNFLVLRRDLIIQYSVIQYRYILPSQVVYFENLTIILYELRSSYLFS